jgi:hypothetical protein
MGQKGICHISQKKTSGEFFIEKEGYSLALTDEIKQYINLNSFKEHFKDIIEYRTINYYKTRFEKTKSGDMI